MHNRALPWAYGKILVMLVMLPKLMKLCAIMWRVKCWKCCPSGPTFPIILQLFRLYEVVSVNQVIVPYKYRKCWKMLPTLTQLCEKKWGAGVFFFCAYSCYFIKGYGLNDQRKMYLLANSDATKVRSYLRPHSLLIYGGFSYT